MSLAKIEVHNIRNIQSAILEPSPTLNLIVGANASGKTSLFEAIFLLGRARSFRTSQVHQLIRIFQTSASVVGRIEGEGSLPFPIGIQLGRGHREIHLNGKIVQSSAELVRAFPVQIICPVSTSLLEAGPKYRRQFLDWGVFHVEHSFLSHWRRYIKALSQRNTILREKRLSDIELWNHELARYGTIVAEARVRYAEQLKPFLLETIRRFFLNERFEMNVHSGWDSSKALEWVLQEEVSTDLRYGYTQSGPHKGDFTMSVNGRSAKAYLSRGQMKLLVYALLLAQSLLMESYMTSLGCVLIDDVASELDQPNKKRLLKFLQERRFQYFISATARDIFKDIEDDSMALFQAEAGQMTKIS